MADVCPPPGEPGVVHISVLGRLLVTIDGDDVTPRGRTQQRLIAALALAACRDARLPLADLVDEVYQDELPPKPRRSLATLVWRLRKRWGTHAIESDQYSYWLPPQRCVVDVAELESQLQEGSALARHGEHDRAVEVLRHGLQLWKHPDRREPFLAPAQSERLHEMHLGATERLGELLVGQGRHREAVAPLERVTALRPDWEHSQALLIGCHLELGDVSDAERVSDQARRALIEQGIEPGPELARALTAVGTDAQPTRPAAQPTHASRPVPAVDGAVDPGEPTDLLGRSTELRTLVTAAETTLRTNSPAVLAVAGEAGIGKSTLVQAVLAQLRNLHPRVATLTLPCDPRRTLPYAALAPMIPHDDETSPLARLLRGEAGADPATSVDRVHAALFERLRALAEPAGLVLLVEDLHWAHAATTAALAAMLERAGGLPVAVVVTTRRRKLPEALTPWVGHRARLRGLGVEHVAELVGAASSEEAAAMHRRTGGNPLYVRQLWASGRTEHEEQPDDLEAAIDAHLQVVPADVLDTLRVAAAVGDTFGIATLVGLDDHELQQDMPTRRRHLDLAAGHGLVRADPESPGQHHFVHTLVREHLYRQLPPEQQTRAHAAIGRALRRIGMSRPCPPDLLAHHYARGWPAVSTCEVVDTLSAAGEAAGAQLDFAQAATHYRTALDHLAMDPQPGPDERVARLLAAAAGASAAAGDTETANELYSSLLRLAQSAGWGRWRLSAALGALRTSYTRRVGHGVTDDLAEAAAAACADGTLAQRPELAGEALAAIQVYRPARSVELLERATAAEPDLSGRLRTAIWEHQDVPDQLETARKLVTDPTADPVSAWLRLWVSEVASGLRALDDPPPRTASINDADDRTRFDLLQWRIATTIATGRLDRARRMLDEALAAPRHPDPAENAHRAASIYGQVTFLDLVSDDFTGVHRSRIMANPTWANRHPIMRYVAAYVATLGETPEQAREMCDDLLEEVRDEVIPDSDIVPRLVLLARACVRAGHREGWQPCLEQLLRHRGQHGIFRFGQYWGPIDAMIGRVQAALGDLDAAVSSLKAAAASAEAIHAKLEVPWIKGSLAEVLARLGRSVDAAIAPRHTA